MDRLNENLSDWIFLEKMIMPSKWDKDIQKYVKRLTCTKFPKKIGLIFIFDKLHRAAKLAKTFISVHEQARHHLQEYLEVHLSLI